MKVIDAWACRAYHNTTDGHGPMYDVCYAATHEAAIKIVKSPSFYKKYGVMGGPPYDNGETHVEQRQLVIFESATDYADGIKTLEKDAAKRTALGKLTDDEKQLLGLK